MRRISSPSSLQEWARIEESKGQLRAARITTVGDIPLVVLAAR